VLTGEQWYNGMTDVQQQKLAGPGAWEGLKSGKATLRDFVQGYDDPVFGEMVREAEQTQGTVGISGVSTAISNTDS
jgi:hypothetical protein